MPDVNVEVSRYQYEFRSLPGENVALLYLYDPAGKAIAMLAFIDKDQPLPEPRQTISGLVVLSYYRRNMTGVIDLLRSEKPVRFTWIANTRIARITTGQEPLGEEEFRSLWSQLFG